MTKLQQHNIFIEVKKIKWKLQQVCLKGFKKSTIGVYTLIDEYDPLKMKRPVEAKAPIMSE